MIVYPDIPQNSKEWRELRAGRATASNFDKIMTPKKMKYSDQAEGYMCELIAACFETDVEEVPQFDSFWTKRGRELEPLARLELAKITSMEVHQVGFCLHENGILGCSPDGLLKSDGEYFAGGEFKCPMPATHVEYMKDGVLPDEYKLQCHGSMLVTGLKEWHFLSFCPGMQTFYIRVTPDEFTEKLAECLDRFVAEYKAMHERLVPKLQLTLTNDERSTLENLHG